MERAIFGGKRSGPFFVIAKGIIHSSNNIMQQKGSFSMPDKRK